MVYAFDKFAIDTDRFELIGPGGPIEAEPQTLEFLIHLIRHRGELVSKASLHEAFWPDRVVSDAALSTLVSNARRLIGDSGREQRFIETRHGRGFRFRADVAEHPAADAEAADVAAEPPPRVAGAPAVAVLPFDVLGDGSGGSLAESICEEVLSALARSRWFPLVARNRVRAFLDLPAEARSPQAELGADYLVEGGVIREGDHMRLHLQLTETATARHIHAARHDLAYSGLFAMLDRVSAIVTSTVHAELGEAERRKAEAVAPEARGAWQNFVLAQHLIAAPDRDANAEARAMFEAAHALEPGSGRIRAGLAMTHLWDYKYDWTETAELSLGAAARDAERALHLAPDDSWAAAILAICKLTLRRFDEALADARRAIASDPGSAMAHGSLCWVLAYSGRYAEALDAYGAAVDLAPRDRRRSLWLTGRAVAEFGLADYAGALSSAGELIALSPDHPSGHRMKAAALARLGRRDEARIAARRVTELLPGHDVDAVIERQPFRAVLAQDYAAALKAAGLWGSGQGVGHETTIPAAPLAVRRAIAADGAGIAWTSAGAGPPLLKPASWVGHLQLDWDSPLWGATLAALARDHVLIRFDQRGTGLSGWDAGPATIADLAADIEAVVDAAGLDRFPVFAMAQGCPATLEFMRRNPGRVSALVVYGGFATGWRRPEWGETGERIEAVATIARLGWDEDEPTFRRVFSKAVLPEAAPAGLAWLDDYVRQSVSARNAVRLLDALGDFDLTGMLAGIDVPVLAIHAEGDASVPVSHGHALADAIPGARFRSFPGANHLLLQSDGHWAETIDLIRGFLRKTA